MLVSYYRQAAPCLGSAQDIHYSPAPSRVLGPSSLRSQEILGLIYKAPFCEGSDTEDNCNMISMHPTHLTAATEVSIGVVVKHGT